MSTWSGCRGDSRKPRLVLRDPLVDRDDIHGPAVRSLPAAAILIEEVEVRVHRYAGYLPMDSHHLGEPFMAHDDSAGICGVHDAAVDEAEADVGADALESAEDHHLFVHRVVCQTYEPDVSTE